MRALPIAALLMLAACANNGGLGQSGGSPGATAATFRDDSPQAVLQTDDAVLVKDPHNVAALLSRGDAQTALQQPDRAAASYTDALRADPHSALARIGLGRLRLADDPAAAEAWFLEASQSDPHNAAAWNDLGIARDLLGHHQDAQAAYRQAIGLDASMHGAQVNLAMSLAMAGRTDNAVPPVQIHVSPPSAPPESTASAPPILAVALAPPGSMTSTPPNLAAPAPLSSALTPPQIVLSATADAWMQVRDMSGHVLLSRILHRGESWPVPAEPKLVLTTGNAGGTEILLDGAAIPSLGGSGAVRRNIPLDADLLTAEKLPSAARPMAAETAGSLMASPLARSALPPSVGVASATSRSAAPESAPPAAPFAAPWGAAPTSAHMTGTAARPEPLASPQPPQAADTAAPARASTPPRTAASTTADATHPADHGFAAAPLSPGMHALTIGVDGVTNTAAPIWPGDRVDLILTQEMPADAAPSGHRVAASMVLPELRVIAIDQQLAQGPTPPNSRMPVRRVTFEVNRDQAERVSSATRLGRLWLAARPADTAHRPADPHLAPPTVWASEAVAIPRPGAAPNANNIVRVFPGAADSKEFHF